MQGKQWALPSFQMTRSDRDVSARKVNLTVIWTVPSHLWPPLCARLFISIKAITPVNKYGLHSCDHAADRWEFATDVLGRGALAQSLLSKRGGFSVAPSCHLRFTHGCQSHCQRTQTNVLCLLLQLYKGAQIFVYILLMFKKDNFVGAVFPLKKVIITTDE